jgi:hypothetical protein
VLNGKKRGRDSALGEAKTKRKELAALVAIPSYRAWCAMVRK